MQVFWPWSSLRMSGLHRAAHVLEHPGARLLDLLVGRGAPVLGAEPVELLVDRRVQEHRQDGRRRAVDGHRHRVARVAQVEAVVQRLDVLQGGDRHPGVAHLAVDVRALVGVEAIQRDRVERGRQALGRGVLGEQLEAPVGARGVAFAGEHARRVLALALEGEHPGGVGEAARQVLAQQPAQHLAVVLPGRQRDLAHRSARQGGVAQRGAHLATADLDDVLRAVVARLDARPDLQQLAGRGFRAWSRAAIRGSRAAPSWPACSSIARAARSCWRFARQLGLRGRGAVVLAHRLGDLRQVALAARRHDRRGPGGQFRGRARQAPPRTPLREAARTSSVGMSFRPSISRRTTRT